MLKRSITSLILLSLSLVLTIFAFPSITSAHSTTTTTSDVKNQAQRVKISHITYTITSGRPEHVKSASPNVSYGCYAVTCDGKDPVATNCSLSALTTVAITVTDNKGTVATGKNVYSSGCKANWTEADSVASRVGSVALIGSAKDSTGKNYFVCFPGTDGYGSCTVTGFYNGSTGWPAYTDMVDGTNIFKACLDPHESYPFTNNCANQ